MRSAPPWVPALAWWGLAAVNLLVVAKYGARLGAWWIPSAAYLAVAGACTIGAARGTGPARAWGRAIRWGLVAASLVVQLACLAAVPPSALRVDRWSAMTAFNAAILDGSFPYAARTHLGNPLWGLPVTYLAGLPFQWLGDVGYLQIAAFAAFVLGCWRVCAGRCDASPALALFATSPLLIWEAAARSDLVSNAIFAVLFLFLCERWRDRKTPARVATLGGLLGLLACTRLVVLGPLVIFLATYFSRREARAAAIMAASAAGTAAAVIAPFILASPRLFADNNPFAHQLALSPAPLVAGVVVACVAAGLLARDFGTQCLAGGFLLLGGVGAAFCLRASATGWEQALFESGFDISYFDLAAPWLVVPLLFACPVRPGRAGPDGSAGHLPVVGDR